MSIACLFEREELDAQRLVHHLLQCNGLRRITLPVASSIGSQFEADLFGRLDRRDLGLNRANLQAEQDAIFLQRVEFALNLRESSLRVLQLLGARLGAPFMLGNQRLIHLQIIFALPPLLIDSGSKLPLVGMAIRLELRHTRGDLAPRPIEGREINPSNSGQDLILAIEPDLGVDCLGLRQIEIAENRSQEFRRLLVASLGLDARAFWKSPSQRHGLIQGGGKPSILHLSPNLRAIGVRFGLAVLQEALDQRHGIVISMLVDQHHGIGIIHARVFRVIAFQQFVLFSGRRHGRGRAFFTQIKELCHRIPQRHVAVDGRPWR